MYQTYSVSSSETDDSPVHNNNKTNSNTQSKGPQYNFAYAAQQSSSLHQYTLPYKSVLQQKSQQQQQQQQIAGSSISAIELNNSLSPSSGNASDATLTDTESTALARKNSSLTNNGK